MDVEQPSEIISTEPDVDVANVVGATAVFLPKLSREAEINQHLLVKKDDKSKLSKDWRDHVNSGKEFKGHKPEVLALFANYLSMWDGLVGHLKSISHHIEPNETHVRPGHAAPFRTEPRGHQFKKVEIDDMLEKGVSEPVYSKWASTIVVAPKKDSSVRVCVDYPRLNAINDEDSYPVPRMDEFIDSLWSNTVYITLDANAGYWQVDVLPSDWEKTTFTSHDGLYRHVRMPFGLKNAHGTFQRAIGVVLARVRWRFALAYLDDMAGPEQHTTHLRKILDILKAAGMTLNL